MQKDLPMTEVFRDLLCTARQLLCQERTVSTCQAVYSLKDCACVPVIIHVHSHMPQLNASEVNVMTEMVQVRVITR